MNEYLATFYTHYGAVKFFKYCEANAVGARQAPVPRQLSASCGVCVVFTSPSWEIVKDAEDMEACFLCEAGGYRQIYSDKHDDTENK